MKIIRTQLHGLLDFGYSAALLLPWITNYSSHTQDTTWFALTGFVVITYSLITDYEWGLVKIISMKAHLVLDVIVSLFTMTIPFIFPSENYTLYWPFILGVGGLIVTILSSSRPYEHKPGDTDITKPYH